MQVPKHRPAVGEKAYPVHSVTLDELLASRSAEMRPENGAMPMARNG